MDNSSFIQFVTRLPSECFPKLFDDINACGIPPKKSSCPCRLFSIPAIFWHCPGTFGGSVEDMAAFVRRMAPEVDAVVVLVNQLAHEDEVSQPIFKSLLLMTVVSRLVKVDYLAWQKQK